MHDDDIDRVGEDLCRSPWVIRADEIARAASNGQAFLVNGAIPAGAITFFSGRPGAKKSWLAYSLAMSVMRGEPWLGFEAPAQGPVLVLNYDNPTELLARRFVQLGLRADDPIYVHSVSGDMQWRIPRDMPVLTAVRRYVRPKLVIVDSFRQCTDSEENSATEMGSVMRHLKSFGADGEGVIVIHHTARAGNLRGSGEIEASADAIVEVDQVRDLKSQRDTDQARWNKHRGWQPPDGKPIELAFEVIDTAPAPHVRTEVRRLGAPASPVVSAQELERRIILHAAAGNSLTPRAALARAIGARKVDVCDAVRRLQEKGELDADA